MIEWFGNRVARLSPVVILAGMLGVLSSRAMAAGEAPVEEGLADETVREVSSDSSKAPPAQASQTQSPGQGTMSADAAALAAAVNAAMAGCSTTADAIPATWQLALVGGMGCITHVPPDWRVQNLGAVFSVTRDATETAGFSYFPFNLPGVAWTVESAGDAVMAELRRTIPDLVSVYASTDESLAGLGIRTRVLMVTFSRAGLGEVGSVRAMFMGCSPVLNSCQALVTLSWAPVSQLNEHVCTLARIEAGVACPQQEDDDQD